MHRISCSRSLQHVTFFVVAASMTSVISSVRNTVLTERAATESRPYRRVSADLSVEPGVGEAQVRIEPHREVLHGGAGRHDLVAIDDVRQRHILQQLLLNLKVDILAR